MSAEEGSPEPVQEQRIAIGISFGNSNSSIAYTTGEGKAEVIANEEGDRQIPSVLSYIDGEEFTGTQAKAQIVRNPRNSIAFFRDYLGKGFDGIDPSPCHASAHPTPVEGGVGFVIQEHVASGEEGDEVEGKADLKQPDKSTLSVSEVTTRLLRRLKQSASDFLGKTVTAAVITVPSDFSDSQKAALSASAEKAGIEVLQFIPETVSALLAHDAKIESDAKSKHGSAAAPQDKVVVVADLGGTRSDVTVIASRGGIYTTLSTTHDFHLGGVTLDRVLVDYAAKEFLKKHKTAKDPRENERSLAKLTMEAENVKKALSLGASASFSIESLSDGLDFSLTVNRTRFELLANKVMMSITRLIESAVQKADLDILDVDAVLLSGGTSHVPKIASNLQSHFPETTTVIAPSTSTTAVNPSELSARGAANQANLVAEFEKDQIEASTEAVVTVTPHLSHAIGILTGGSTAGKEDFSILIEPETPVPVRRTAQITVKEGGDVMIKLAEGISSVVVSQADKAPNGNAGSDNDDDDDDSDDEPEETRSKVWTPEKVVAEAGLRGVKKGGIVEVQVDVATDLSVTLVCREKGSKGGVRGTVAAGRAELNGNAS